MNDTPKTAEPKVASRPVARQKVPPFARYEGTSAWRKYHRRAREYARFLVAEKAASQTAGA